MDFKQIQELIRMINKSQIGEVRIEEKDFKITIKSLAQVENLARIDAGYPLPPMNLSTAGMPPSMTGPELQALPPASPTPAAPPPPAATPATAEEKLLTIKSPMIGTFYRSGGPDKEPFVKVGENIAAGSVICIIEAMKLFNEIESEVNGRIVKILVDNASPVEYDQPLFLVEPA